MSFLLNCTSSALVDACSVKVEPLGCFSEGKQQKALPEKVSMFTYANYWTDESQHQLPTERLGMQKLQVPFVVILSKEEF